MLGMFINGELTMEADDRVKLYLDLSVIFF